MSCARPCWFLCFFFNDTATTEIYTLSLHDALPICFNGHRRGWFLFPGRFFGGAAKEARSEEHTSELQSHEHIVCRLLLEKKKHNMQEAANKQNSSVTLTGLESVDA